MKALLQRIKQHRIATAIIALFVVYNLVGFLLLPWLVRSFIPEQISERFLNGELAIERVAVNPYTFTCRVEGLVLKDQERAVVGEVVRTFVDFDPLRSLFTRSFVIRAIEIENPSSGLTLLEDGSLSLLGLLQERESKEPDSASRLSLPLLTVDSFELIGGELDLTDQWIGGGFSQRVFNVEISAESFSTDPEANNTIILAAETANGAKIHWIGGVQFDPLSSKGTLSIMDFRSDAYSPYYGKLFAAELSTEGLDVSIDYVFAPAAEQPQIGIFNTRLEQTDVALKEPADGRILMSAQRIVMDGIEVDFIAGNASISRLIVDGEQFFAARDKNNEINLLQYLLPKGFEPARIQITHNSEQVGEDAEKIPPDLIAQGGQKDILYAIQRAVAYLQSMIELAWQVELDYLEIKSREIELRDENLVTPALLIIESFDLVVAELSNKEGEDANLELSLNIRGGGSIKVSGSVTPFPTTMQLSYKVEGIDLSVMSPYLQTLNRSELQSGRLHTEGTLFVDFSRLIASRALPELKIEGSLGIDAFALLESSEKATRLVLSWDSLEVRDYSAATEPEHHLRLEEVRLVRPYSHLEVLEDGMLSWQALIPPSASSHEETQETGSIEFGISEPEQPLYALDIRLPVAIDVAAVVVEDGIFEIKDQFYGPGFEAKWESLTIDIRPLTTRGETPIRIQASGLEANGSRFDSTIALASPLLVEREIEMTFRTDVLATPFSPYAAQVVGFPVEEGRVAVDAAFRLSQDAVDARVKIDMDQFRLGEKSAAGELVINLPVKLALSLMKDREGKIDLPEIRVDGSLKDPEFNIGEVIGAVLVKMIINAATKPFAFLAGSFGGGEEEEDLEQLLFEPGSAEVPEDQIGKLEILGEALFNRPQLNLIIRGYADSISEADPVKVALLDSDLAEFVGLGRVDALKVLYHDRLPEAFAQFQVQGEGTLQAEESVQVEGVLLVPQESLSSDLRTSEEKSSLIFRVTRGFLGLGSKQKAIASVMPDGAPVERETHVSGDPQIRWEEHPALKNEDLLFPEADLMEAALLKTLAIPETFWAELAEARCQTVRQILLASGKLPEERVLVELPALTEEAPVISGVRFKIK